MDAYSGTVNVLRRTEPWLRLASLVGFLASGLMVSFAVDGAFGGLRPQRFDAAPFIVLYLVLAAVFLVPSYYLNKFARRIRAFVAQGHPVQLEAALEVHRKFWKFTGVLAVAALVVLVLAAGLALI